MEKTVTILKDCLDQLINVDPDVEDVGREWWYISPLYRKDQEIPDMSVSELEDRIRGLNFKSIKEVSSFQIFKHKVIQVRGDRLEIIKECDNFLQ